MAGIAGLSVKKPHPLAHTLQSTPALAGSLVTVALRFTDVPTCIPDGTKGTKVIECVFDATIVIPLDKAVALETAVDVAMILTGTPGETGGAT
jgi:hypothetical protein